MLHHCQHHRLCNGLEPYLMASDLRFQLIKYLNRVNVSLLSPYEWEETEEYKANKGLKLDNNVYERNVKNIT
ncbi:hypothetical protein GCK32_014798, partial [Trichostrongylus colubriformis]